MPVRASGKWLDPRQELSGPDERTPSGRMQVQRLTTTEISRSAGAEFCSLDRDPSKSLSEISSQERTSATLDDNGFSPTHFGHCQSAAVSGTRATRRFRAVRRLGSRSVGNQ